MALHVPTHGAGLFQQHQVLRDALIAIVALALALGAVLAATIVFPGLTSTSSSMTEVERMNEFRAGERALYQLPIQTEQERWNEFRAGERGE
jgi:hypothetical protein